MSRLAYVGTAGWAVIGARWSLRNATKLGKSVRCWGRPILRNPGGRILIGDKVRIVSNVVPVELAVGEEGTLDIGEGTYINYGSSISAAKLIRIGLRFNIGSVRHMFVHEF